MEITNDIIYVGVNDHQVDLFEGHYIVPEGMAYNSYVIKDEKTAVMDSVDGHFTAEWIENVKAALDGASPDYDFIRWPAGGAFPAELMRHETPWSLSPNPAVCDLSLGEPRVLLEELTSGGKLIRPRYECVEDFRSYTPMENR